MNRENSFLLFLIGGIVVFLLGFQYLNKSSILGISTIAQLQNMPGGDNGGGKPGVAQPTSIPVQPLPISTPIPNVTSVVPQQPLPVNSDDGTKTVDLASPNVNVVLVNNNNTVVAIAQPITQATTQPVTQNTNNPQAPQATTQPVINTILITDLLKIPSNTNSPNLSVVIAPTQQPIQQQPPLAYGQQVQPVIVAPTQTTVQKVLSYIPFLPQPTSPPAPIGNQSIGYETVDSEQNISQSSLPYTAQYVPSGLPFISSNAVPIPTSAITNLTVAANSFVLEGKAVDVVYQWLAFNQITVTPTANGGFIVQRNNAAAYVANPLGISLSRVTLVVNTLAGPENIEYLPDKSIRRLKDLGLITGVINPSVISPNVSATISAPVEMGILYDTPQGLQYHYDAYSQQYFLALIPIKINMDVCISAQTNELCGVRQSTLSKVADLTSI